uniref:CCR4-NOT transcription complex subunit 9 n=2 Tax=Schistocephalus solidus TaxID=70667 RepID=A0A0X3NSF5_SCHSO
MQPIGGNLPKDFNPLSANVNLPQSASNTSRQSIESLCACIDALNNPETREKALLELCKQRENFQDFAPILWHSYGAIASLLQEICAVYPYINPPNLSAHQSNRVCNALALLQCLASHRDTRSEFLKANIPFYLYNFLNTNNRTRPFEYLRLTSLGVIGALAKTDEPEAINFLLSSEIIPLCLLIMESGSELSKTVATFIMQKLLQDDVGLAYICQTYERFAHVAAVLNKMVSQLAKEQSLRLLKHVIRCYQRLSDDIRARDALCSCLPEQLTDGTFANLLSSDIATKRSLSQFLRQLSLPNSATATIATSSSMLISQPGSSVNSGLERPSSPAVTATSTTGSNGAPTSVAAAGTSSASGANNAALTAAATTTTPTTTVVASSAAAATPRGNANNNLTATVTNSTSATPATAVAPASSPSASS